MDKEKLVQQLANTTSPEADKRAEGEAYLEQVQKIVSLVPSLLEISVSNQYDPAVLQAAAIYMKNMITKFWEEKNEGVDPSVPQVFTIHEQDRHFVREHIIDTLAVASDPIRLQLCTCIQQILREDFPHKWPGFADKVMLKLEANDGHSCLCALLVLHRLVKIYEYRKMKEKEPLHSTMKVFLPVLFERLTLLLDNPSREAVFLQKMILKIFFALVQHSLSFEMISKEDFLRWMDVVLKVVERPVPDEQMQVDADDRPELVWWKCKKWAAHLMSRVLDRYGSPGQTDTTYNKFAEFYLKEIGKRSIESMLGVLHLYTQQQYVAPRVLFYSLEYLDHSCAHAFLWKVIRPHIQQVIKEVVFPLMKHSQEDEELWEEDPQEYIRHKFDIFDDLQDPSHAALNLLTAVVKRGQMLKQVVDFSVAIMNSSSASPLDTDAAFHIIGGIAPSLLKKKVYNKDVETMIVSLVLPRVQCEHRFLRARACWVLQQFAEAPWSNEENLRGTTERLVQLVLHDTELPVRLEAAMAIQMLLSEQEKVEDILRPHVKEFVVCVLKLISETENDDLTSVMEKLIETYMDEIKPVAVEVANELANVFQHFLTNEEFSEDRALTAMGILNTLESILNVMEEHKEIMVHLEAIVLRIIKVILENSVMDFYEEVLSLVASLTASHVSAEMWQVYVLLHQMFKDEGIDFFTDFMFALHNYVTVDTDAFLANPDYLRIMLEMITQVLTTEQDDDTASHAAKLLECIVLQCKGRIDQYISGICQLVIARLSQEINTSELRAMLIQVVIACLYYNTDLTWQVLQSLSVDPNQPIVEKFVRMWLYDTDCFLGIHDRKLCLIGLTILMTCANKPGLLAEKDVSDQILPACLMLFDGLTRAYQEQADLKKMEEEDDDDEDSDVEDNDDGLESDEDAIDDAQLEYLERLNKSERDSGNDGSSDVSSSDGGMYDETDLEAFETPLDGEDSELDEFMMFKQALQHLQEHEGAWYAQLTHALSEQQHKDLHKIILTADQRKNLAESKKIQKSGGYQFNASDPVPTSFNFSS